MRSAREIMGGVKSVFNPSYRRDEVIKQAIHSLSVSQPALEFINSQGWQAMMRKYKEIAVELESYLRSLCRHSKANQAEIQKTSDFIDAFQTVVGMTNKVVTMHNNATKTIVKNQGTDR